MSQQRLAELAGVSLKTINSYEAHDERSEPRKQEGKIGQVWYALGLPAQQLTDLLHGTTAPTRRESDEIAELRSTVMSSRVISDAARQAILTLIEAESITRQGDKSVTSGREVV